MKKSFAILLLLFSFQGFTQDFNDDVKREIRALKIKTTDKQIPDTTRVHALFDLANLYYIKYPDSAILICLEAKKLAEKIRFESGMAESYGWLGYLYREEGNFERALNYNLKSLHLHQKLGEKEGEATSLNNIGNLYENEGHIALGLEYYHKSLKLYQEIGDQNGVAFSFNNIGYIYQRQKENDLALEYFHNSLNVREKEPESERDPNDKRGIALTYNNLGNVYKVKGEIKKSLFNYKKSLSLSEEIGDRSSIAISLINIGKLYYVESQDSLWAPEKKVQDSLLDLAENYYNRALLISKEINDRAGLTSCYYDLGNLEQVKGNIFRAIEFGEKSLSAAYDLGYPENIRNAANLLSSLYEEQGNVEKAYEMYKLYVEMQNTVQNEETKKAAIWRQAQYDYEKQKTKDDAARDKQIAIEKQEKEAQQIKTYAAVSILVLVIVFLFFVANRLKITRRQKSVIETQKQVVESSHQKLEEKNREIMDSITYAKRIQSAILPPSKVVKEYLQDSFILYKPKDIVAGDFYWMEHRLDTVFFAAADCTGHGVPGAMVSVVCNNALNRSVREYSLSDPGKILDKTREIVIAEFEKSDDDVKDGMDIALCSLQGRKLTFAGANNSLLLIRNGELIELKADKQPIGKFDAPMPYTTHTIMLEKGDSIYIFTDGYVDQFGGERGKKFMSRPFKELLLSLQDKSMTEQKEILDEAFENWRGENEQVDDVCVIGVKM